MKLLTLILMLLASFTVKAQFIFKSDHYELDGKIYNTPTEIYFDSGKPPIVYHNNGLDIRNYPLKLSNVKDTEEPFIVSLEPDIAPENYNNSIFKTYDYRGYQIYFKGGKIIGVAEIIKSYYSKVVSIIKYK
ncbi:hypothetical protein IX39_04410 [Chryseobacterium formosense]|uniref:Uncharacterized protein n=1 Tax=Chryseobacterium formosense TaxID=236814 RepID=A0A085Z637_9FLAO|nr:hypothetical protein [Chryseobacterium formosense]KFE99900.1 hypothetical protein IX39_04410 [Chryseobacterium formosense]SFT59761.1 hypothetical protein SAMN05421857_1966 [Chryseobacterium formosense]